MKRGGELGGHCKSSLVAVDKVKCLSEVDSKVEEVERAGTDNPSSHH